MRLLLWHYASKSNGTGCTYWSFSLLGQATVPFIFKCINHNHAHKCFSMLTVLSIQYILQCANISHISSSMKDPWSIGEAVAPALLPSIEWQQVLGCSPSSQSFWDSCTELTASLSTFPELWNLTFSYIFLQTSPCTGRSTHFRQTKMLSPWVVDLAMAIGV